MRICRRKRGGKLERRAKECEGRRNGRRHEKEREEKKNGLGWILTSY